MGTRLHVVVEAADRAAGRRVTEAALREVERIDALLSTWDPATPLSQLNRTAPGVWAAVDPELAGLLAETERWADRTAGAFEPRIGALLDAWDLRGAGRIPELTHLTAAVASVGRAGMQLADRRVKRISGTAWIDSGGFGKGAALRAATGVTSAGSRCDDLRVLLDFGGQISVLAPPDSPWTVQIAHPLDRSVSVASLSLYDASVSTSGSSERGRHVVDPRTGRPVEPWGSVSVVDRDALVADVLSTALYVMGPREGLAWARRAGVAALFLEAADGLVEASWTSAMEPWLNNTDPSFGRQIRED